MHAPPDIIDGMGTIHFQRYTLALEIEAANLKLAEIGRRGGHLRLEEVDAIRESIRLRQELSQTKQSKILAESRQPITNFRSIRRRMEQIIKQGAIVRREVARYNERINAILEELGG